MDRRRAFIVVAILLVFISMEAATVLAQGKGNDDGNNGKGKGDDKGNKGDGKSGGNGKSDDKENNGKGKGNDKKEKDNDAAANKYDKMDPVPGTGQERGQCKNKGSCYNTTLTCPSQCPERKPKKNKKNKGCFINCGSKCEATCKCKYIFLISSSIDIVKPAN